MRKTALAFVCVAGLGVAAAQATGAGTLRPTPDRSAETRKAARSLAGAISVRRSFVRRARFSALPPFSNPAAVSTKRLAGFPIAGKAFAILSTGSALRADDANDEPDTSGSLGGPAIRGSRDVTILRLDLVVPEGANCLSIRFRFLTEEFPEYVTSEYNDAFIAELDESTWNTVSKEDPRIDAPKNFATTAEGGLISVNAAGPTRLTAANAKGTTYDGATRRLRASTRVTPGNHILYLSIFDQGDRQFDSAVFLDRLTLDRRTPCANGAVADS